MKRSLVRAAALAFVVMTGCSSSSASDEYPTSSLDLKFVPAPAFSDEGYPDGGNDMAIELSKRAPQLLNAAFGGSWLDQGRVWINVAAPIDDKIENDVHDVAAWLGLTASDYALVEVRYSLRQLNDAQDWLEDQLDHANHGAMLTLALGPRVDLDAVELAVPRSYVTAAQLELVRRAQDHLGDMLVFELWSGVAMAR